MKRTCPSGSRANTPDSRSQKPSSGKRHVGRKHVGQAPRVEVDPEHRGAADDGTVARVERIDPRHGGGADALGQLVAIAGGRGRQQVEQELGAAPGALDGQLQHVRRYLRWLPGSPALAHAHPRRDSAVELDPRMLVVGERQAAGTSAG